MGLGLAAMCADLGVHVKVRLRTDASTAKSIATRRGLGKVRHIEVALLWLQQKVNDSVIDIMKVKGEVNLADGLTKALEGPAVAKHRELTNQLVVSGRHEKALKFESAAEVQVQPFQELQSLEGGQEGYGPSILSSTALHTAWGYNKLGLALHEVHDACMAHSNLSSFKCEEVRWIQSLSNHNMSSEGGESVYQPGVPQDIRLGQDYPPYIHSRREVTKPRPEGYREWVVSRSSAELDYQNPVIEEAMRQLTKEISDTEPNGELVQNIAGDITGDTAVNRIQEATADGPDWRSVGRNTSLEKPNDVVTKIAFVKLARMHFMNGVDQDNKVVTQTEFERVSTSVINQSNIINQKAIRSLSEEASGQMELNQLAEKCGYHKMAGSKYLLIEGRRVESYLPPVFAVYLSEFAHLFEVKVLEGEGKTIVALWTEGIYPTHLKATTFQGQIRRDFAYECLKMDKHLNYIVQFTPEGSDPHVHWGKYRLMSNLAMYMMMRLKARRTDAMSAHHNLTGKLLTREVLQSAERLQQVMTDLDEQATRQVHSLRLLDELQIKCEDMVSKLNSEYHQKTPVSDIEESFEKFVNSVVTQYAVRGHTQNGKDLIAKATAVSMALGWAMKNDNQAFSDYHPRGLLSTDQGYDYIWSQVQQMLDNNGVKVVATSEPLDESDMLGRTKVEFREKRIRLSELDDDHKNTKYVSHWLMHRLAAGSGDKINNQRALARLAQMFLDQVTSLQNEKPDSTIKPQAIEDWAIWEQIGLSPEEGVKLVKEPKRR